MPHMHGVSGFVAQGAPIRQVLRAVGSLIGPKAPDTLVQHWRAESTGMTINIVWERNGFLLRSASLGDSEPYYGQNYNPLDREPVKMTGCKDSFTR